MAVLSLGTGNPQPACAAGTSEAGKTCCCTGNPICKCHPERPCKQSCTLARAQAFDKQIPARTAPAPSPQSDTLLFTIASTRIKYLILAPLAHRRDLKSSPPFGGAPGPARVSL